MHSTVKNLSDIQNNINIHLNKLNILSNPKIVAVSKTFTIDKILPLIQHGHIDYGENKVQEAVEKWTETKKNNPLVRLHMIGKLQTNKVKFAVKIFDYIHSVDSEKLAKKIAEEQNKVNKKIKIFLQVNIGDEGQKSGINKNDLTKLVTYCKEIGLDVLEQKLAHGGINEVILATNPTVEGETTAHYLPSFVINTKWVHRE